MNQLLAEYYEIEEAIKPLEARKSIVRANILEALKKEKMDKIETPFGKFTVARKTTWRYSEVVEKLAEKLKITKSKEEKKGIATPEVSEYLLFTKPKADAVE